jgi:Transposase DDE domain
MEDVADTAANAVHFGRLTEGNSRSPFPLLRCLYLVECGTHAIVDAILAPVRKSEQAMAKGLLRSIEPQMLVLLDRGFFCGWLLEALKTRGAEALVRLPSGVLGYPLRYLPDGSYLAQLLPAHSAGLQAPLTLRIITYRLSDPSLPSAERPIRLATTLLDPKQAPAAELMRLYHERWEIELVIDEIKNHQCLAGRTLRSKTPEGVYQEMYGLLLAHYALRALMLQVAEEADLDPERISFSLTVELVGRAVRAFVQAAPCEHARLKAQLLRELAQAPLPARTLRLQERVVKRRFSKWKRKRDSQFFSYHERARTQPALCQVKWLAFI